MDLSLDSTSAALSRFFYLAAINDGIKPFLTGCERFSGRFVSP